MKQLGHTIKQIAGCLYIKPNLIAILLLSKTGITVWKDYVKQRKAGILDPKFDPKSLCIKNAEFWEKDK